MNKVFTADQFFDHADDMSPALRAHLLERSDHSEMLDLFQLNPHIMEKVMELKRQKVLNKLYKAMNVLMDSLHNQKEQ